MRKHMLLIIIFSLSSLSEQEKSKDPNVNIYSAVGKRDPFRVPRFETQNRSTAEVSALEKYNLDKLVLRAILQGAGKSHALFEDPDFKTFIVNESDTIGREKAKVSRILNTEVIVTERTFNYQGKERLFERVFTLSTEEDNRTKDSSGGKSSAATSAATDSASLSSQVSTTLNSPKFDSPAADSKRAADKSETPSINAFGVGGGNVQ